MAGLTKRDVLAWILLFGCFLGFGFLIYLTLLPSDVEGRVLGPYSAVRLILMAGPLIGASGMFALARKTIRDQAWGDRFAHALLGRRDTVPRILTVTVVAALTVISGLLLYRPSLLTGLNKYHMARLLPYYVWPAMMLALLGAAWMAFWWRDRFDLSPAMRDALAALFLFLLSFSVRYPLTGYGLPYQSVWDEVTTYTRALSLIAGPDLPPVRAVPGYGGATYGDLLIEVTSAGQVAGLLTGLRSQQVSSLAKFVAPPPGIGSIYEAVHISGLPLRSPRVLLAIMNSLAPALMFVALRRWLGTMWWPSLIGALIYAVMSVEVIYHSSYIVPDALATTISLGALLAAMAAVSDETGKRIYYLVCGILVGLAVSVSIRYVSMAIVPLVAAGLTRDRSNLVSKLGLAAIGILGSFILTSPGALADPSSYLTGMTSLVWRSDYSAAHRLESLIFYMQRAFGPVETNGGLGVLTLLLALVGTGQLLLSRPRLAVLIGAVASIHLILVTPIIERYSRHVLLLYPLACVLAGLGLDGSISAISGLLNRRNWIPRLPASSRRWMSNENAKRWGATLLVVVGFLLLSSPQLRTSLRYVVSRATFVPSQVAMASFLEQALQPGDRVGILDLIPWVKTDLRDRKIDFERIGLDATLDQLRHRGITYVVGTDAVAPSVYSISGTIWDTAFDGPSERIAEFGFDQLSHKGYPMGNLYLFVGRIPEPPTVGGG